ncbi:MAG: hypothetical protein HC895_16045 [Leptolyngbyaceae cyanobacterium SM1_3_5]|nr:hypothetical protein [Leptolyngbyaceae cyanobacterium SM1_3_5]
MPKPRSARACPAPRFGQPGTWLAGTLTTDGEPLRSPINGIYLNAVWATQSQTFENEVLGSSNAQPNQVFFARNLPVLAGAAIEVRELEGLRAPVELPLLIEELQQQGLSEAIRTVTDRRSGQVTQVWVRWQEQPNLFFPAQAIATSFWSAVRGASCLATGSKAGFHLPEWTTFVCKPIDRVAD